MRTVQRKYRAGFLFDFRGLIDDRTAFRQELVIVAPKQTMFGTLKLSSATFRPTLTTDYWLL